MCCDRVKEDLVRIDRVSEEIGTVQSLKNSFNPILNVILMALDAPPVFMRTKALRSLGQIVTSDPSILSSVNYPHRGFASTLTFARRMSVKPSRAIYWIALPPCETLLSSSLVNTWWNRQKSRNFGGVFSMGLGIKQKRGSCI